MRRIDIAYCADDNYVEYLAVSLISVSLNNLNNDVYFHLFLFNVSQKNLNMLSEIKANIIFYHIDNDVMRKYDQKFSIKHLNMSTYMRLIVPRMLHGKVNNFIYLDIDTLCFSDLSEINHVDITNHICAVSSDTLNDIDNKNTKRLGLKSNYYFNAGFLYINVNNWLDFDVENKINQLISEKADSLIYYDQDALNKVLENHIVKLDHSWNYLYTWMDLDEKEKYFYSKSSIPKILHFTGGRKPWFKEHEGLSQNLFIFYKHLTPWKDTELRSYSTRMKNSDNRVYCREAWHKKRYGTAIKFYLVYLKNKLKG
ncbi:MULTISPECIES: glycosyltransferase family 8 protein [Providencia]|uniref:Glycosyl transferase family 8 n=1 Tax=Providencia rettgeri TaxID=587 RepID=A0A264VMA7_PRORE|nr:MULTISPECIES: glycosyltransferase family 8 protein [Providencia]OZS72486.1 glycosyl transferase family 8 [Providencia rettgeri]